MTRGAPKQPRAQLSPVAPLTYAYTSLVTGKTAYYVRFDRARRGPFASLAEALAYRDSAAPPALIARAEKQRDASRSSRFVRETGKDVRRLVALEILTHDCERPTTRADCIDAPRPCPWYSCRHHLGLDVLPDGGLQYIDPEELEDMPHTCALDAAEDGPRVLEDVGDLLYVTRERIRQIESGALDASRKPARKLGATPTYSEHHTIWDELDAMDRLG